MIQTKGGPHGRKFIYTSQSENYRQGGGEDDAGGVIAVACGLLQGVWGCHQIKDFKRTIMLGNVCL